MSVDLTDSILTAEVNLLRPELAKVKVKAGKMSYSKTIKVEDLITILKGCKEEALKIERIPRCPQGMIDLWYGQKTDFVVSIFVPGDLRPTAYLKEKNEKFIPYPSLIFFFKVESGNISESKVFAVKAQRARAVHDETELFKFPYGNVWGESGKICWGSNGQAVRDKKLSDMEEVVETFFNAVMNNDLYNGRGLNGGGTVVKTISLEQLLDKMSQEDKFPEKLLVPFGSSYGEVMGRLSGGFNNTH